ncbi:pimeloyl-ACP methyl ester carboxylesterase [Natronospira proteinivora]|uniref:Pimeloyl-ACP methyl ester carboxylesterase n=1 Tax=Natronospira proteinivora TaxID=1807133 RepID=A0ABT1G7F1_9GAMM|nr:alpha/beta fold hydrolase [Natronospira proteinivora]MCP1726880.1 pimeloyl-ACP methyl ester carboxylesterase [Natronospira proteinivora]
MARVIYFAHGQESGPWGSKILLLADIARSRGLAVESPDYRFSLDGLPRLTELRRRLADDPRKKLLVGSSMGAWVSCMAASEQGCQGLFLMAPAFEMPDHEPAHLPRKLPAWIIHGSEDAVVPVSQSETRLRGGQDRLLRVPDGHRLANSHDVLSRFFEAFLNQNAA